MPKTYSKKDKKETGIYAGPYRKPFARRPLAESEIKTPPAKVEATPKQTPKHGPSRPAKVIQASPKVEKEQEIEPTPKRSLSRSAKATQISPKIEKHQETKSTPKRGRGRPPKAKQPYPKSEVEGEQDVFGSGPTSKYSVARGQAATMTPRRQTSSRPANLQRCQPCKSRCKACTGVVRPCDQCTDVGLACYEQEEEKPVPNYLVHFDGTVTHKGPCLGSALEGPQRWENEKAYWSFLNAKEQKRKKADLETQK